MLDILHANARFSFDPFKRYDLSRETNPRWRFRRSALRDTPCDHFLGNIPSGNDFSEFRRTEDAVLFDLQSKLSTGRVDVAAFFPSNGRGDRP